VDALGSDDDEVYGDSGIKTTSRAESIDFLDISFRLEKAFGIKIGKGEMMLRVCQRSNFAQDDRIHECRIGRAEKRMPFRTSPIRKEPDCRK